MTSNKPSNSKIVLLAISGLFCVMFLVAAFSNILSTQSNRLSQEYQLLILLGSVCNLVGGIAGLISIALSYRASRSTLLRLSVPLISAILIPDFITIYLNKISHPESWSVLLLNISILVFIYFSIQWKRKSSGQANINDPKLVEK